MVNILSLHLISGYNITSFWKDGNKFIGKEFEIGWWSWLIMLMVNWNFLDRHDRPIVMFVIVTREEKIPIFSVVTKDKAYSW